MGQKLLQAVEPFTSPLNGFQVRVTAFRVKQELGFIRSDINYSPFGGNQCIFNKKEHELVQRLMKEPGL